MKSDKNFRSGKINDVVWLERVTGLVTKLMLTESVTSYEQSHLLELLSKAMFGRNFFCKGLLVETKVDHFVANIIPSHPLMSIIPRLPPLNSLIFIQC